jgi:hypothetical protein
VRISEAGGWRIDRPSLEPSSTITGGHQLRRQRASPRAPGFRPPIR